MNISKWLSLMLGQRTVYLCPPIHGQIFDHGKPLAHHPVHLWLSYDKEWNYETTTDENGCFNFPRQIFKTFKPVVFYGETPVFQHLYVLKDDNEYILWHSVSPGYGEQEYQVIIDRLATLSGDLNNSLKKFYLIDNETSQEIPTHSICELNANYKEMP